jgi:hypothetical protein
MSYDESFESLVSDDDITPHELEILERELSRLEEEFE